MTATDNGKPTAKARALASLGDVKIEVARDGGPRPVVLAALLADAVQHVEAIEELRRARSKRKSAVSA